VCFDGHEEVFCNFDYKGYSGRESSGEVVLFYFSYVYDKVLKKKNE
jgi:hypothetical protein